jgi:hypothetical protein
MHRTEMVIANLRKTYPDELQEIIQVVVGYLIYYEYLR